MEQIFVGHIIKSIEISLSESVMESWWNQHLVIDKMCCNKTIMEALIKNTNESNHLENEHYLQRYQLFGGETLVPNSFGYCNKQDTF